MAMDAWLRDKLVFLWPEDLGRLHMFGVHLFGVGSLFYHK
jgi:hypothetical protein